MAVTKTISPEFVGEALQAGIIDFGENYVQELISKREELRDERIRWHFIGHLQSNKVKHIAPWIHLIHSVDSLDLGRRISNLAIEAKRVIDILVEVNTTSETTKSGISIADAGFLVDSLSSLRGIKLCGLMTIGRFLPDPEASRPSFRALRELRDSLASEKVSLPILSMGMTNDFEIAIEEGATLVRIGTAIFGPRTKNR